MMKYIFFLFTIYYSIIAIPVEAERVPTVGFLIPETVQVGIPFTVDIVFDTAGQSVNAASISVQYDPSLLVFNGYSEGGSISVWFTTPHESVPGIITGIGIIPGGSNRAYDPLDQTYHTLTLMRLRFTPLQMGSHTFSVQDSDIRLNNGTGAPLTHITTTRFVAIIPTPGGIKIPVDTAPPQPFSITQEPAVPLARSPNVLIFSATDTESGILRYEVRVGNGRWRVAQSPLPLPPHFIPITVRVRAYDFSGNVRESTIRIPGTWQSGAAASGALLLFGGIIFFALRNKRRSQSVGA